MCPVVPVVPVAGVLEVPVGYGLRNDNDDDDNDDNDDEVSILPWRYRDLWEQFPSPVEIPYLLEYRQGLDTGRMPGAMATYLARWLSDTTMAVCHDGLRWLWTTVVEVHGCHKGITSTARA